MNIEEIKKNKPDTIIYYRGVFVWKQYFIKNKDNGFWYLYIEPFWFYYDSEKPKFIKLL